MFQDRSDAGRRLAGALGGERDRPDMVVALALPRGGVPVAAEVAAALHLPLDVLVVRKLGLPSHPELAMGAVASGGARVLNPDVLRRFQVTPAVLEAVTARERQELERRERVYREGRTPLRLAGQTALLIDDGLATGASMRAAVEAARQLQAARVVVAVPVASAATCRDLGGEVDQLVCLQTPPFFAAVGQVYRHFGQTGDGEVLALLAQAAANQRQGWRGDGL